jgi:outer membrane protein OmpA-like peptidoglycan-associated protein
MVNDRSIELPVIEATRRSPDDSRVIRVQVLDDERFPLLLDYYMPGRNKFFITYTRISFPTDGEIERRLATGERLDVYGIYFDLGRDLLRAESEPVLREIADVDLSKRRSDAVRRARIERYRIEGARLITEGYGASQPKAPNDSSEGRALNRRVELIRR